jgi:rhamnose utilization protein RhaD (predicted bifunctional aldolase and dehydrogenase)
MNTTDSHIKEKILEFCNKIGRDRLLVQGSGGNVSWKDGDTLWIKGSGEKISDAKIKDIFVPVDLILLRDAISTNFFDVKPKVTIQSIQRPSIETILHAIFAQKIVVHFHAVEIVSRLIWKDLKFLEKKLSIPNVYTCLIDYIKPGPKLASAVYSALCSQPNLNVVFLKNHGVVIAANNCNEIEDIMRALLLLFQNKLYIQSYLIADKSQINYDVIHHGYIYSQDRELTQISLNPQLHSKLLRSWAICPDQIVFLGEEPSILGVNLTIDDLKNKISPPYIFDLGKGLYEKVGITDTQRSQLKFYFDILIRQPEDAQIDSLSKESIKDLLDWDAEKYRINKSLND